MPMTHPDPALVERAISELALWDVETGGDGTWEVIERVEYPRSVIFFLGVADDSDTRLVYKVKTNPDKGGRRPGGVEAVNEMVRRLRSERLMAAPILAVHPEERTVITLYVPGEGFEPLKWWKMGLSEVEARTYLDIGRACRIAESPLRSSPEKVTKDLARKYEHLIDAATIDPGLARNLREWGSSRLARIAGQPDPYVMSISDMTYSNVVVSTASTGFIDLGLSAALRGHSISKMLHRIEYHHLFRSRGADAAVAALLDGYGPLHAPEAEFLRVERLLRTLRGSATGARAALSARRRRAIAELETIIG